MTKLSNSSSRTGNDSPASSKHNPRVGIPLAVIACFFNAAMATTIKMLGGRILSQTVVFMRFTTSLVLMTVIVLAFPKYRPIKKTLTMNVWPPYVIRILAGMACLYAYFYAIQAISLSNAVLLVYTAPLFIPVIVWVWKAIPIQKQLWWGLIAGFIGVLFVIGPSFEHLQIAYLIGLISGILAGITFVCNRLQTHTESVVTINFYFYLAGSTISFLFNAKPFIENFSAISGSDWILLICVGTFGLIYQALMVLALKYTQARFIGAFMYSTVLFAVLLEIALFKSFPSIYTWIGIALIVSGAVLMTLLDPIKKSQSQN